MENGILKKTMVWIELCVPYCNKYKADVKRLTRKIIRRPHEQDFEAVRYFSEQEGDVYVDVGANYGQTIESILLYKPEAKIISFEANPRLAKLLGELYANKLNIEIKSYGLGNRNSECDLFVPHYRDLAFEGLASFKKEQAINAVGKDIMLKFKPQYLHVAELRCEIKTLDSFELSPFFVKLDIEGGEYDAIKGGISTIRRHLPILLIEGVKEGDRVFCLLQDLGYKHYRYKSGNFYLGQFGSPNSFFIPDSRLDRIRGSVVYE
ncbi:FkbM family methyltransferase [Methylocaldum sp.]|uniref:FkbM family methyltransferase n=1 Tax=Methylocaldum sp. TaxID=1969727 RepID=UPI002D5EC803|nr:FkbM family methyltransferase [Methylocaldum sp.]HYE34628.1 FkbM family methyltransferase [Methylocaldum sp.]